MNIDLNTAQQLIDMIADAAIRVINETRVNAPAATATPRVRRTKAEIAAAAAAAEAELKETMPPEQAAHLAEVKAAKAAMREEMAPAAPAAPAADVTALRAKLIAAVRTSLATNGEDDTKARLGHPNISSVPNEELQATIDRVLA